MLMVGSVVGVMAAMGLKSQEPTKRSTGKLTTGAQIPTNVIHNATGKKDCYKSCEDIDTAVEEAMPS
jgi:hypothetical protein